MPALLTSTGRPGFYFRVLREGDVGAGDEIVKVGEAGERMTVAEINALLYSPNHPRDRLERALRIDALSPGWRWSFEALLRNDTAASGSGNGGLMPAAAAHPAASGFRALTVTAIDRESDDVLSISMRGADDQPLPPGLPGQFVVVRLQPEGAGRPLFRSYSLSGAASTEHYRISVKIEPNGVAGNYLANHLVAGDALDVSAPRGSFIMQSGDRPIVLLSAGIGATPLLAMLHALAAARSSRPVWWLHSARDGRHHPFAAEVRRLLLALPHSRGYVCYSRPGPDDAIGEFDATGRLSRAALDAIGVPTDADVYICGPTPFMGDMKEVLATLGFAAERMHVEIFNGSESLMPGIVGAPRRAPHLPEGENADATGPVVSFARSGIAVHWKASSYNSILELAEACDVPVRWSCRTGVCHNCESGLISGAVAYGPEPLDKPADGNLLVCCSQPLRDVVIDL
jgi:ferredoxin-NADP reductase/ferredoxin